MLSMLAASGLPYIFGMLLIGLVSGVGSPKAAAGRIAFRILALLSAALIAVSATPAPLWLLAPLGAALLAWLVVPSKDAKYDALRGALRILLPVAALIAVVFELPYHVMPSAFPCDEPICVLGDSLSAGVGDGAEVWPNVLARKRNLSVRNLARAGAAMADGVSQAARLPKSATTVILLLGGNDLLGGKPAEEFEHDLDEVLTACAAGGHHVLMFELPLPPSAADYGRVQRSLAARHGATLLPKRALALLLARPGMTSDGLHFSARGHMALAEMVNDVLVPSGAPGESK